MRWNRRTLRAALLTIWLCALAFPQAPAPPPPTPPQSAVPNTMQPPVPAAPIIMIDAAHGGTESGAVLAPDVLEKDVTLAFSRRLRQDLLSRGLQAKLVRDGDMLLSTDQRAAIATA